MESAVAGHGRICCELIASSRRSRKRAEFGEWLIRDGLPQEFADPIPAFTLADSHSKKVARSVRKITLYVALMPIVAVPKLRFVELDCFVQHHLRKHAFDGAVTH